MYNLDAAPVSEDCPKCKHTLERLAEYNSIKKNEGYSIDDGTGQNNFITYLLFGWMGVVIKLFVRNVAGPLWDQRAGEKKQSKYAAILNVFPNSRICPYCKHIVRQK